MHRGYIKLWRRSIDSRVFKNPEILKVWVWCLMKANHKPAWVEMKSGKSKIEIKVEPGQFVFGRKSAAKELGMKESSVRNRMEKLKNMRNVDIKADRQYSIVSIINWDIYQPQENKEDSKEDSRRTGKGQAKDTNKNYKNEENVNIPSNGIPYQKIIAHLNKKSNKNFKPNAKDTQRLIKSRWNEGFTFENFCQVIDSKCAKWLTDSKMVDYLRPQTLFGTKFESYLNEQPTMFDEPEEFL